MKYFEKVAQLLGTDLQFVIEDITDGDDDKVGVIWWGFVGRFATPLHLD